MNIKNKREVVWDLLKLYAMLSVVLDHTLTLWFPNIQSTQLYNFIFLTQMPLFMMISGYLFYSKLEQKISISNFTKTLKSLMIPFFTFVVIKSLIDGELLKLPINIYNAILKPDLSLWFLWVLAIIQLLMLLSIVIINKLNIKKQFLKLLCTLISYIILCIPLIYIYIFINKTCFDIKLIIYYSIYFIYGLCICYFNKIYTSKTFSIILLIISLLTLIYVMITHPTIIFDNENLINMIMRIIGSLAAINLFVVLGRFFQNYTFIKQLSVYGKYSLELYYIHLLLIKSKLFDFSITNINIYNFTTLYISVVLLSFIIILLIKKNKIINLILFGKTNHLERKI